ncbi:hypothetical protein AgCh_011836 [Apium graveolens]
MHIESDFPPVTADGKPVHINDWVLSLGDGLAPAFALDDDVDPSSVEIPKEVNGMPNHEIEVKVGIPIMVLRNLNLKKGLCNVVSQVSSMLEQKYVSLSGEFTSLQSQQSQFQSSFDMRVAEIAQLQTDKR